MADLREENLHRLISDVVRGGGENALAMGTGLAGQMFGGLHGLGAGVNAAISSALRGDFRGAKDAAAEAAAARSRATQEAMTYEPRSDVGQRGQENIGAAIGPTVEWGKENLIDPIGERSPLAGAMLMGMASQAGPKGVKPKPKTAKTSVGFAPPEGQRILGADEPFPGQLVTTSNNKAAAELNFNPAETYPPVGPPQLAFDKKKKKHFLEKNLTPQAMLVNKMRADAQGAIDRGEYTPFFDVTKREHVDPSNYNMPVNTVTEAWPKKEATREKYRAQADTPEARERLTAGYERGRQDPGARDWYAIKQVEDAFIDELGPVAGRKAFEKQVNAYAATTGGSNPTENLMMGHYAQTMDKAGKAFPPSHQLPFPIGGRYVKGNLEMFDKLGRGGKDFTVDEPKRTNFKYNQLGRRGSSTIDEQMMGAFDPSGEFKVPPGGAYGAYESVVNDLAAKHGEPRSGFQDNA